MCFYHDDYDWCAGLVEENDPVADKPLSCDECRRTIKPGETYHTIYMQQYEECQRCEEGECACAASGRCCECSKPEYGEKFDYACCCDCQVFLAAIQEAEEEEGCTGNEARPGLGGMTEEISNGGPANAKRYFKTALRRSPELKPYLGKLWNRLFVGSM